MTSLRERQRRPSLFPLPRYGIFVIFQGIDGSYRDSPGKFFRRQSFRIDAIG